MATFRNKFKIKKIVSNKISSIVERDNAEAILAKLVARAYATDHPELFCQVTSDTTREDADL